MNAKHTHRIVHSIAVPTARNAMREAVYLVVENVDGGRAVDVFIDVVEARDYVKQIGGTAA